MHREISHTESTFSKESRLSLYLFTVLLGVLIALDLWPWFAGWLTNYGWHLPTWPRSFPLPRLRFEIQIALIPAILGGARILYGSLESLIEGRIGADLALAIACIAAILTREPLVAAEIVFIGMVGECLESITFERTQRAIRKLVEVFPHHCWLVRDGKEIQVHSHDVHVGDHVLVKPGGRVPVDGVVLEGRSALDVSPLTGESLPMDKGPGDEVLAGSVNQFGALTVEARRVAEHTVAGRVIEVTARALKDKAPLERTADKLARYFLPAVLGLAAITFLVSFGWLYTLNYALPSPSSTGERSLYAIFERSVYPALAVLVVACPCALILATPAAVIAALGRLAGTGVLIKGGSALERLAGVTAFAFDKTGTLTEGRLELGDVIGLGGVSSDEVLRIAASAEQRSEHPLARLITQAARSKELILDLVEDFLAHPGAGVTARSGAGPMVVGTRRLLEEQGIAVSSEVDSVLGQLDATGQTALLVARDGVVLGVIGARDRIRPEARSVIHELRHLGITDIALLTGDRLAAAKPIAEELGISEVHAELLPQEKAEFVARWQRGEADRETGRQGDKETRRQGDSPLTTHHSPLTTHHSHRRVAMVGDGINDAPALACANVGLAIGGTGTDIAAEAGDIVFMGDPLHPLPLLVRLSRETVRIIRQNIFIFAFGVNAVGIVLTAWLLPLLAPQWYRQSPIAAVIYHQFGSLAVLLNAMRLLWFERGKASPFRLWLRHKFHHVDHWLEHHLNPDEAFHWLGHRWRRVLVGLALLIVIIYALTGLTVIGPDEVAVVRRFDRPLEQDFEPGLYWRWPWPIEDVVRVQPDRIRSVEVGFRSRQETGTEAGGLSWSSPHGEGQKRLPDESVMNTGDNKLVELQAVIRYRLARPSENPSAYRTYLFQVSDPDEIIRATTESVIREVAASRPFLDLLTSDREQFQKNVLAGIKKRCQEYQPNGLGVEFDSLSIRDLHPPQEVVAKYHGVAEALQRRYQSVKKAEVEKLNQVTDAEIEGYRKVTSAKAAAAEKVLIEEAERDVFIARQEARKEHPQLTDLRLVLEAWIESLRNNTKVIIDTEKAPRTLRLLLGDPEQFRVPAPLLTSPSKDQR